MIQKPNPDPNPDDIKGASALLEISAMARVGMLGTGANLNEIRAKQMDRDAERMVKRNRPDRAEALRQASGNLRQLGSAITQQQEQEQIRPAIPSAEETILQGRATSKGRGAGKLRVVLADKKGKVLAEATSGDNGAFILRSPNDIPKSAKLKLLDTDGNELGDMDAPKLVKAQAGYMDIRLETLRPRS